MVFPKLGGYISSVYTSNGIYSRFLLNIGFVIDLSELKNKLFYSITIY